LPLSWAEVKDIADSIQATATAIAIVVGGIWTYLLFIQKRQKFPRAKIGHQVTQRIIGKGKLLLSIDTIISNDGDVLLSLKSGEISVRQMLPPKAQLLDILNGEPGSEIRQWQPLVPIRNPTWQKGELEIEPGESQQLPCHFVIDDNVETILVTTYIRNFEKPGRIIGWELNTVHDLRLHDDPD
jgi:hypothetical protein